MRRPDRFQWPIVQVVPSEVPCRRLCAHSGTPVPVPDTWTLSPPDKDQNTSGRRLPLVWRRCIHAATDTVVRRPHGRLPGDRLARLDLLARRRLAEEAPGHTAPKLRGAHARNSAQGVLMRRQTWRTPDVAATLRPMVRNAAGWDRSQPAWRRGTNFFKQSAVSANPLKYSELEGGRRTLRVRTRCARPDLPNFPGPQTCPIRIPLPYHELGLPNIDPNNDKGSY